MLQEIDKIMSESFVLSSIYSFVMYSINMSFYIFMSCQDRKHGFDTLVKTLIFIPVIIFIKIYFDNQVIAFLIESLILFLVVFLSSKYKFKDSLKNFIICHLLTLIYQLISLFIRSLNIQIGYYGFITTVLLNLDYYILLLITYLYKERRIKND